MFALILVIVVVIFFMDTKLVQVITTTCLNYCNNLLYFSYIKIHNLTLKKLFCIRVRWLY